MNDDIAQNDEETENKDSDDGCVEETTTSLRNDENIETAFSLAWDAIKL